MNAVKLSFTILAAAALSLDVSHASSHRSKTDNRSGYILRRGSIQSATTSSVASGLKTVRPLPTAYRSLRAILRSPLLNAFDAGPLPLARLKRLDIIKPLTSRITSRSSRAQTPEYYRSCHVCLRPTARADTLGNIYVVDTWNSSRRDPDTLDYSLISYAKTQVFIAGGSSIFKGDMYRFCWFSWGRIILKQMFLSLGWAIDWAPFAQDWLSCSSKKEKSLTEHNMEIMKVTENIW